MFGIAPTNPSHALLRRLQALTIGLLAGLLLMQAHPVNADDTTTQSTSGPQPTDSDAWRLRATTYGWLMSVSGNVTARGQAVDVDASFFQLFQKSQSLLGFDGYFEASKGSVGFYADLVWAKLGFTSSMAAYRNPIAGLKLGATADTAATYSMTIVEAGGLYEVARWPGSPGSFTALDALLGFRYWNNAVEANLDIVGSVDLSRLGLERTRSFAVARSGSMDWVAPLVGARLRHQFTPAQEAFVRGDVGGFGLQSQFEWQAVAVYSYAWQFTGYQLAAVIGYRALGVNYANGSGFNGNSVNVVLHGPLIGFSVRF